MREFDAATSNLRNLPKSLRDRIEGFLANDSVHDFTKDTVRAGLMLDPVDALRGANDAVDIFGEVAEGLGENLKESKSGV